MRTVYLGTSEFAATVLRRLNDSPHAPALVVTRPARPKGRGRLLQQPPVADLAAELGLPVFQPESVNDDDSYTQIAAGEPQALIVCAFGALIKEPLLGAWPTFNVHPSLLPRWRGAAPIERAVAFGDEQTGVSIMSLTAELDAGDVCVQEAIKIGFDEDFGSLSGRLAGLSGELLVDALDCFEQGRIEWRSQDEYGGAGSLTYAKKIERDDRHLKPLETSAVDMARMVRALHPHVGAFLSLADGSLLVVEQAQALTDGLAAGDVSADDGRLIVGAQQGALEILRLRPAGKQSMDAASYLRGRPNLDLTKEAT